MLGLIERIKDKTGATAIEYALIAGLISIVAVVSMTLIGGQLSTTFSTVGSGFGS